ncbi:MAG TPA: hypothetical protein PK620_16715, partial [Denitromonas sp.]|nr:hypothetical protein [Denitromonas sp.]
EAARLAGLGSYHRVEASMPLPLRLQLLQHLVPELSQAAPGVGAQWLSQLRRDALEMLSWNDPDHLYAHCQCAPLAP